MIASSCYRTFETFGACVSGRTRYSAFAISGATHEQSCDRDSFIQNALIGGDGTNTTLDFVYLLEEA